MRVMKNKFQSATASGRWASEGGSVMMEYLILNFGVILTIIVASHFFLPDMDLEMNERRDVYEIQNGKFVKTEETGRYGRFGEAYLKRFKLMVHVISMPFP